MRPRHICQLSVFAYLACLALIAVTLVYGTETKGARRWLSCLGMSIQPSEFIKPCIVAITAWLISEQYKNHKFPGIALSAVCVSATVSLLLFQPDIGMIVIIVSTWIGQLFVSGLSITMILAFAFSSVGAVFWLYSALPHFASRVDKFFVRGDPDVDTYQVQKSIEAFSSGGVFGKGPGEGLIKTLVPDAHSDFVFPVIAEEFGLITCIAIIALFIFFVTRLMIRILASPSIFNLSVVFGILLQLGLQVLINVATSLDIIPTKGMTMPFISYGGSSFLSSSISVGIILALTKRKLIAKDS
jgi:cell division protein FtsW